MLSWKSAKDGGFTVNGFKMSLRGAYADKKTSNKGMLGFAAGWFKGGSKLRVPSSKADPSELAGEKVETEDDVLHLKQLPRFHERISGMDSEWLLQVTSQPFAHFIDKLNQNR